MFQPIQADPSPDQVRRITFVPFLTDGRCVLIDERGNPALPSGEVLDGEHYLLDTVLRVPLQTAGFRYQRFHPFGRDRDHLYAWIEGGPYAGSRPHRAVALLVCSAEEAARRLDEDGFGGDAWEWEQARRHITEGIAGDGTFLDVGCANGLLMESVAAWCAERGLAVEPYGVDISPVLAELARCRLPRWAGRIWIGNAVNWQPPGTMRFDYVHILLDCVPRTRRADLIQHHLAHTVRPGTGRLLVSDYAADPAAGHPVAAETLTALGFRCAGQTSGGGRLGRPPSPTAWISAYPAP
jgi:SAM-dependent methyltransferase